MNRRTVLHTGVAVGTVATTGCLFGFGDTWGANRELELRNAYNETVQLNVTVERENHPQGGGKPTTTTVFEKTVTVDAGEQKAVDALGDASYRVTVQWGERTLVFRTQPNCNDAYTQVMVDKDGDLRAKIRDCEGGTIEWTEQPQTAS